MAQKFSAYREAPPGPHYYTTNNSAFNPKGSALIGSRSELELVVQGKDSPGPGKYETISGFNNRKSWSLGKKFKRKDETDAPGPGAYTINDLRALATFMLKPHSRNTSVSRVKSHISKSDSNKSLPLCYRGVDNWSTNPKGIKFTSCIRQLKFRGESNDNPGPGYYTYINKTFGSEGRRTSLKPKIEFKDPKAEIPGPGSYSLKSLSLGSTFDK